MFRRLCAALALFAVGTQAAEANPPKWPDSVKVLDPATPGVSQSIIDAIFAENGGHNPAWNGQFSNSRYALLFLPGNHNVQANVGYYTSLVGLGSSTKDTAIAKLNCDNGDWNYEGGALANFWRSAENFVTSGDIDWAVSQAAPLRRMIVNGNLALWQYNSGCCAGYASGGFLADVQVTGTISSGSQQQWFTRNANMGSWSGGVWNMVFMGNSGAAPTASSCGSPKPFTVLPSTPVIAEKPYIWMDPTTGRYFLRVPQIELNKVGTSSFGKGEADLDIDFNDVYVANAANDTAATINAKLDAGLHVVLSAGVYQLTDSLRITKPGTVLLGLQATLVSAVPAGGSGVPLLRVGNVNGVRVGGILFQAGAAPTPTLVQWGDVGGYAGDPNNPGFFYDAFARVGGTNDPNVQQVQTDIMVQINSDYVVVDNTWFWRADHDVSGLVMNSANPNAHGLVVNGNHVSIYGLAAEHSLHDLVVWNGEYGRTVFLQSELPYDVTQNNFGSLGYAAYRIGANVQYHELWGPGIYSFFRDFSVTVQSAIVVGSPSQPIPPGIKIVNPVIVHLNGLGSIKHVVNNLGDGTNSSYTVSWYCQ